MGLPDLAIDAAKRAAELDPLAFIDRANIAVFAVSQNRFGEAIASAREALALQPGGVEPLGILCEVLAASKQFDEARRVQAQIATLSDEAKQPGPHAACTFWIAVNYGNTAEARSVMAEIVAHYPGNGVMAGDISTGYRVLGENDEALKWYIRALDAREVAMLQSPYFAKGPREVFGTRAWLDIRNRADVQTYETARARIAVEFAPKSRGA
jgi:tetratricopeptide (TPR) repeat protein